MVGRPKKDEDKKRQRITITTLPIILKELDYQRNYMTRSEFIHRILANWYNDIHPDDKVRFWEPEKKE